MEGRTWTGLCSTETMDEEEKPHCSIFHKMGIWCCPPPHTHTHTHTQLLPRLACSAPGGVSGSVPRCGEDYCQAWLRAFVEGSPGHLSRALLRVSWPFLTYTRHAPTSGLCTDCFLCLECCSPRLTPSQLTLFLQVFAEISLS